MHRLLLATRDACALATRNAFIVIAAAGLLGVFLSGTALAGKPQYTEIVISDSEGGDEIDAFAPGTAKIHITADLVDVSPGMKISSKWIAEKCKGAPANYQIDGIAMTVAPKVNVAHFSLSKPNAGWPVGIYRVELSINDKLTDTVHFKVEE